MSEPHVVNGEANPDVRHERTDVDTRAVLWFVAGLGVFLAIVMLVLWGMFVLFLRTETAEKVSAYPLAVQERTLPLPERLPPDPRLEGVSVQGLEMPPGRVYQPALGASHDVGRIRKSSAAVLAAQQERVLNSYGWVEGKQGQVAHIPIAEAMAQLADKLPARKGETPRGRNEFRAEPSGSSSGRAPREGQP
jgi:hypothetical protein